MIIRPVVAVDRAGWEALYQAYAEFYDVHQTAEMRAKVWAWLMAPHHEVAGWVAEDKGVLVGLAHTRCFSRPLAAASGLFLDDLFVASAQRGGGVATALLAKIKQEAAKAGHSVVRWITAEDNINARKLYDRHAEATRWVTYDMSVPSDPA